MSNNQRLLAIIEKAGRSRLTKLNLSLEGLTVLPPQIKQLHNLTKLDLGGNQLTYLPPEIGQLTNLTSLDLGGNQLTSLPPQIGQLRKLNDLDLSGNQLTSLPPQIGQLSNLLSLKLRSNQLTSLPTEIGRLTSLRKLDLIDNRLTSLPLTIGQLSNLVLLSLIFNRLTHLPPEIGQLRHLTCLDLSRNQLTHLPREIGQLTNITKLDFSRNNLTYLPLEIGRLTNLKELNLKNNPLNIPPEILEQTNQSTTILNYYLQSKTGLNKPLNEAKMLVVGQGSVGKTSLVKQLIHHSFDAEENKTEGIDIQSWRIFLANQEIKLNVWDFGGQEIMHATHQFFLTKRSLYLLVLDSRMGEEENRLEYWLKIIQSFGGDSPIIIASNKIDQHPLDLDRRGLQQKYPQIRAILETSCKTNQGLEELKQLITQEVSQLECLSDELLLSWYKVKSRLEKIEQDYIPYAEYERICIEQGINQEIDQRSLIHFLHDLGAVLNFYDDERLLDTSVLNPQWVTNAVYKILNDKELIVDYKGILERDLLNRILDPQKYPWHKHLFIINVMRKFELCFELEADKKFLIPDLLPKEEPDTGEWQDILAFQYHYNILPNSIMSRFLVRINNLISRKTYWRNGVVLNDEGNRALVKADKEEKKIIIWVTGQKSTRRSLLRVIRSQFDSIHTTISGLHAEEKVPLPNFPHILVDYQHLLNLEQLGEVDFIPYGIKAKVNVKELLDGIISLEERTQLRTKSEEEPLWQKEPAELPPQPPKQASHSPFSGFFYLFALFGITALLAVVSQYVPWYVLPEIIIGAILAVGIVGVLQLKQMGLLSDASFVKVIENILEKLSLVRGGESDEDSLEEEILDLFDND